MPHLITGGARSGKSAYAEQLAHAHRGPVCYLATAEVRDDEFRQRVARQRPVVILAGAGHVEHGWGIASRILALNPEATILGVVPVRDAEDFAQQTSPDHPTLAGELLYFYCAAQHRSRLGMNVVFEDRAIRATEIIPGSAADKAGLRPDDVLIASGDKPLTSATDLHFAAMAAARSKQPLALTVRRGAQTLQLALPLE